MSEGNGVAARLVHLEEAIREQTVATRDLRDLLHKIDRSAAEDRVEQQRIKDDLNGLGGRLSRELEAHEKRWKTYEVSSDSRQRWLTGIVLVVLTGYGGVLTVLLQASL